MNPPDIPQNEANRLQALRSLALLDSPAEERFDRLTRLAKRLFDVPIALVSLVDERRQWFKSNDGLQCSETSREISFCGHAILGNDFFIVEDASKDERFADNPLVIGAPYLRFYAGYPLKYLGEGNLGTLCLMDTEPRTLSKEDLDSLKDLAGIAEKELEAVQLATLDELTKISNRRGFISLGKQALSICLRQEVSATIIFFDLDKFKPINDKFGHAEGDRALIAFANLMGNSFRDSDVFARLGGDEFVVLLTDTSYELAEATVARFAASVANYNKKSNRGYDISFSEGIVTIEHDQAYTLEALLNRADSLMYANKHKQ